MLYSRKVKSCDKSTGFPPIKTSLQIIHSWFQLLWTQHKAVIKRRGLLTEGNGSSSSLVKELKGYDEEGIRCAQHGFKRQELLEWDQPVIEGVFLVEEETKKKSIVKDVLLLDTYWIAASSSNKTAWIFPTDSQQ